MLELMRSCLGWPPDDRAEALWRWKHEANPAGPSPVWVGVSHDEVVAVRAFLRWRLRSPDGRTVRAVRAVDTATRADHQGRGWFRRLTLQGLEELRADGVELVFNTPNDASRAGYLSMGWKEHGRLATCVQMARLGSVPRLLKARVAADLWPDGLPEAPGWQVLPPAQAFADEGIGPVADGREPAAWATIKDAAFLRWRYGLEPLGYRVLATQEGPDHGWVVVRRRRRADAVELAVLDSGAPAGDRLAREVAHAVVGVDHAVAIGRRFGGSWLPLPGQGPRLVVRMLAGETHPDRWGLTLGDVELL